MLASYTLDTTEEHLSVPTGTRGKVSCKSEIRVVRQLIEALIFEGLVDFCFEDGLFTFQVGDNFVTANGKQTLFSRVRLDANSIKINGDPLTLSDAAKIIHTFPCSKERQNKLVEELKHTLLLCRWNQQNLLQLSSRRALSYIRLESALIEGHPYHPCFKSRSGTKT